jgi:hypothetical protein
MLSSRSLFRTDRRAGLSILVALMLPAMIAAGALVLDGGLWLIERARLQIAADAAANGAGYLLTVTSLQAQSAAQQAAAFQAVALAEAQGATGGGKLIGALVTPIGVAVASDWSSVTVTLTAQATGVLASAFGISPPRLTATATDGLKPAGACVLALNGTAADAIDVNNMGAIRANGCGIFANSSATGAIYLNSGTLSGTTVGTVGTFSKSNSGSNTLSPASPTDRAAPVSNPFASLSPPTISGCDWPSGTSFSAWKSTPYAFSPSNNTNVFCGNTTIGGNGSTDTFAPGVYYVVNGNLVFNNATVTQAQGVTFVLTGSSPGALQWTNYSNTSTNMTAPTSGATAGILFWQECGSGGTSPANSMAGGSSLVVSGAFYAPCGALNMSNNAQFTTAAGQSMSVIANTISAVGSAGISATSASTGTGAANRPRLTQ